MRDLPAPSPVATLTSDRTYRLEQIDEAAVVQLYADGFADLSLKEKVIVWDPLESTCRHASLSIL